MHVRLLASALAVSLVVAGCSGGGENAVNVPESTAEAVQVLEGRLVLPVVSGSPGAAYFKLVNDSNEPVKILSIDVGGASMAMMHDTIDKGGVSTMQMVHNAVVPAHGSMDFAPGGRHVMATGLKPELKAGASTLLRINFDSGSFVATAIPVVPPAAAGQ